MSFFRKPATWIFAAVWLLATLHCGLQAAVGWFDQDDAANCWSLVPDGSPDGCEIVEEAGYRAGETLKAPTPDLAKCLSLICVFAVPATALRDASLCSSASSDRPLDWVPTWSFERRAAPAPRAPSSLVA